MEREYFKIAIKNLRTRSLRSWLTILGIVIGIFLISSLLSLSEGLKEAVMKQLQMMGKDLIIVFPGEITDMMTVFVGGMELSDDDIEAIRKADGVEAVGAVNFKAEVVKYQGESKTLLLSGNPWKEALEIYQSDLGWVLSDGRWPALGKREVIVGNFVPKDIFSGMRLGDSIVIKGRQFEVVGILQSLGSKQDDSMIGLDLDIFREITGERKGAKTAFAKTQAGFSVDEVAENIKKKLSESRKRIRGEDAPSFSVLTSEKAGGIVGNIMGIIQLAVFFFASIAILVGGIGIMNTMYTSVFERTKEIGILKAVGAKNSTIVQIFLIESGIIGLVGGIGGIILGLTFAKSIEAYIQFHPVFYMRASVSPGLVIFCLTFSFLLGCLSGFFPSRRAAQLKPVDALRYE